MTDDIGAILVERGKTHGQFEDHARITQGFKDLLDIELDRRACRLQAPLSCRARETLDMILHKIGRIVAGQWDHPDHWEDIAGYAVLVVEGEHPKKTPEPTSDATAARDLELFREETEARKTTPASSPCTCSCSCECANCCSSIYFDGILPDGVRCRRAETSTTRSMPTKPVAVAWGYGDTEIPSD